jgi:hypothetical protein
LDKSVIQNSREIRSNPTEDKANAKKNETAKKNKSKKNKNEKKSSKNKKVSGKSSKKNSGKKKSQKKKNTKLAKKSKGKKAKSGGKTEKKEGKQKIKDVVGGVKQSGCLASNCLDLAVSYMNLLRVRVTNYQNQKARIARQKGTTQGKADKKTNFMNSLNQLITAGGGNMSNLTCGGKNTTNAGKYTNLLSSRGEHH